MAEEAPMETNGAPALDPFRDILGIDVPDDRRAELTAAYGAILAEIRLLRSLDLTDVHPAVVFSPLGQGEGNR
jgi:hypothetical protein